MSTKKKPSVKNLTSTSKFNEMNSKILEFAHDKIEYLIGPTLLLAVMSLTLAGYLALNSEANYNLPKDTQSFADTSVRIMNVEMNSGGTGVILKSTPTMSTILTNKHVCRVIQDGGVIEYKNRTTLIRDYQKYKYHDLCLIRVMEDLKVNTKVSSKAPNLYTPAYISGHPALLPHVLTSASFSNKTQIQLVTGIRECRESELDTAECKFFGAMPIIEDFNTQLVTGTILPGSSGSAVFNSEGEIAGLVFAGNGRGLSYAFVVPQEYVSDFVTSAVDSDYLQITKRSLIDVMLDSIFDTNVLNTCPKSSQQGSGVKRVCTLLEADITWRN